MAAAETRDAEAHFEAGDIVAERYRVVRFIARGGMGEVYEVADSALGAHVALKALRAHLVTDADAGERFRREILLARQVTHPNVCRIFDLAYHRGRLPVLTMELLSGRTLSERLRTEGSLAPSEALPLVEQITAALAEAHRRGIVHRDLKSANIMLEAGGRVVVTDFGLARSLGSGDSVVRSVVGTPAYMAPEQVTGGTIGPHTDIYALGVVLKEMLGGKPAPDHPPSLPQPWAAVIDRCLQIEPRARWASMDEVMAALRGHAPAMARPLAPGAAIGRYRVLGPVANAGSGVYRARDSTLGRSVSIRVLPPGAAVAQRRLDRVTDELRAAGVDEIGVHEGSAYIVSDLEGGTRLRALLDRGRLSRRRALRIAASVADALAAAHESGVVLGDLRPEGIVVEDDGGVELSEVPAARLRAHLGVPRPPPSPYTAPEPVLDARSDVYSLGVILRELLRLDGDVRPLVLRCTAGDPARRLQSARDLAFELGQMRRLSRRARIALAVAAALALAAAAVGVTLWLRPPRRGGAHVEYERLTYHRGRVGNARFAGDGQTILYSAAGPGQPMRVYTTLAGARESRALTDAGYDLGAVSPSGGLALLHRSARAMVLSTMSLAGAAARDVAEHVRLADWGRGDELAVLRVEPPTWARVLELPLGKELLSSTANISALRVSPDGERVAFAEHPIEYDDAGRVAVADRAGKVTYLSPIQGVLKGVAWRPDGKEVWFSAQETGSRVGLYAATLGGRVRYVVGLPLMATLLDVGPRGALVTIDDVSMFAYARLAGTERPRDLSWLDYSLVTGVSADGKTLVFNEGAMGSSDDYEAYVRPTDGGPALRLGRGFTSQISPDGKWVLAFQRDGARHKAVLLPTGTGQPRELARGPITFYHHLFAGFFRDGSRVLLMGKAAGDWQVWEQDVFGGPPRPLTEEGWRLAGGAPVSPDGDRVIVVDTRGERSLRVLSTGTRIEIPGLEARLVVLRFTEDGRGLLVWSRDGTAMKVERLDLETGSRTAVTKVELDGELWTGPFVTPDGQTVVFSARRFQQTLFLVSGIWD